MEPILPAHRFQLAGLRIFLAIHRNKVRRGDGIHQVFFRAVRIIACHRLYAVDAVNDRQAECPVIDGKLEVFAVVGLVEMRIEIKEPPHRIIGRPVGTYDLVFAFVLHPAVENLNRNLRFINLAAQIHFRRKRFGFSVVFARHGLDGNVLAVPVIVVAFHYKFALGLPAGAIICAVVKDGVVGCAVVLCTLRGKRAVCGHECDIGQHGEEVRTGVFQRILERIRIKRLHTYLREIGDGAVKILSRVFDNAAYDIDIGGFVRGIENPLKAKHKIVRCGFGILVKFISVPLHAFAQVKRPHQTVVRNFP